MREWRKSGDYSSLEEFIRAKTGVSPEELINPPKVNPAAIPGLCHAARLIEQSVAAKTPIVIVGDYDADGITSTAIMLHLLMALGAASIRYAIPKRFTDGYGLSEKMISNVHDSLIITVDNGIAAAEAIEAAQQQNNRVIVLDHHLPQEIIPSADVLVDPHVEPDKNPFTGYCGAGLSYKLAELMFQKLEGKEAEKQWANITVLACLGTIADVMPMLGDNRRIVKDGLHIMNDEAALQMLTPGLQQVILLADGPYTEDTIKYKLAPILNACGRLYNAGSSAVVRQLMDKSRLTAVQNAVQMKNINDRRKELVAKWMAAIKPVCDKWIASPIIVTGGYNIPEGIIGILAGQVAKDYRRPAIIFTMKKGEPHAKGSARSYGGFDFSKMIEQILPLCENGGGHAGAAGLTINPANLDKIRKMCVEYMEASEFKADESIYYDLEVTPGECGCISNELVKYAPYGEGNPMPVFLVKGIHCHTRRDGRYYIRMGMDESHIKLLSDGLSVVAFGLAEEYIQMGAPSTVDVIGDISENEFRGVKSVQVLAEDIRISE